MNVKIPSLWNSNAKILDSWIKGECNDYLVLWWLWSWAFLWDLEWNGHVFALIRTHCSDNVTSLPKTSGVPTYLFPLTSFQRSCSSNHGLWGALPYTRPPILQLQVLPLHAEKHISCRFVLFISFARLVTDIITSYFYSGVQICCFPANSVYEKEIRGPPPRCLSYNNTEQKYGWI